MQKISGRMKSGRITIKEVADAARVSTATVSNVMNSTGKVGQATRDRVLTVIVTMKWKPNKAARGLARIR